MLTSLRTLKLDISSRWHQGSRNLGITYLRQLYGIGGSRAQCETFTTQNIVIDEYLNRGGHRNNQEIILIVLCRLFGCGHPEYKNHNQSSMIDLKGADHSLLCSQVEKSLPSSDDHCQQDYNFDELKSFSTVHPDIFDRVSQDQRKHAKTSSFNPGDVIRGSFLLWHLMIPAHPACPASVVIPSFESSIMRDRYRSFVTPKNWRTSKGDTISHRSRPFGPAWPRNLMCARSNDVIGHDFPATVKSA